MTPDVEFSIWDILGESLGFIWKPGTAAIQLRMNHNIRAVEDIPIAAQKVGCQISYVTLPTKVSGFAQVIEGTPHIVVNRAKSSSHTTFTIAHELGHHQLHLTSSPNSEQRVQSTNPTAEFEANVFATMLVATTASHEQQDRMLVDNPEMQSSAVVALFATFFAILMAVVIWFCSRLFCSPDSALIQTT
jgi:Zn-dependent peptidase ImmA (M78 family)